MAEDGLILDNWTLLSFKRALGTKKQPGTSWAAPVWVGKHARRLRAYKMLQAYADNAGREYLGEISDEDRAEHREYGDTGLLNETIRSALLGDGQEITVEGAAETDDEGNPENPEAVSLQEWMNKWANDERFALKLIETERNAVNLGDGVYTLGWSGKKGRPRLRVFDPGFYFPVLDDGPEDDFPTKVHIAWEIDDDEPGIELKIRRITWELKEGETSYSHPWNKQATTLTCFLTDAVWVLPNNQQRSVNDLSGATAVYTVDEDGEEIRDRDLGIDFIPVVHEPNTISLLNHYGQASVARVLQILDDLANADSDLQKASATTGFPPIALGGATMAERITYRPGQVLEVGDGHLDVLDTSKSLDALIKYVEALRDRLSVNARTPDSLLGRVKPSEVPSGVALALSFGPLASMINEMRLVRDEKYALLFRFAHRIAVRSQMPEVPQVFDLKTTLEMGPFLPQDVQEAVEIVRKLLGNANEPAAISLETAVTILQAAGLPIEDAHDEIKRIQNRDFKGAGLLLDATGEPDEVADYLDRAVAPPAPATPPPVPPGAAGGPPEVQPPPGTGAQV